MIMILRRIEAVSLWRLRVTATVAVSLAGLSTGSLAETSMPIADAHVHYSHDSVEMTPPARVVEIMREANLKFALVSSSDDNGTQLLSELAPDIIIPGLRPYRRRGELNSWYNDPDALAYVEKLLTTNRYASLGEFHIFGEDAELPILRRIVELADEYNLVLHAHSDADAVERLLAQSPTVKVLWAHSGFDNPEQIGAMLSKHDRLWADLAFRSEVGSGGELSDAWIKLFTDFPDRMMLGTDTFTPERIFYIPSHAKNARQWLASLPDELAENVAWKNAHDLLMPIWQANKGVAVSTKGDAAAGAQSICASDVGPDEVVIDDDGRAVRIKPLDAISVSQPFPVTVTLCGKRNEDTSLQLDAQMPAHGHGMNYAPEHTIVDKTDEQLSIKAQGVVLHMPGEWQWQVKINEAGSVRTLTHDFAVEK